MILGLLNAYSQRAFNASNRIGFLSLKPEEIGNISACFFDKKTLDLSGWRTIDAYSNEVIFLIRNVKSNVLIQKKIFKIPKEEDL